MLNFIAFFKKKERPNGRSLVRETGLEPVW